VSRADWQFALQKEGFMKQCSGFFLVLLLAFALPAACAADAPFNYLRGTAYHVMPGTHTDESGYFSLCEGLDGSIYVGTAAYNRNAYLVEYNPATDRQRIVIDTNKLCGLTATGYAAQAKIHTKNFVGPSGKIYVGSKQGYRSQGDTSEYPGGYVMTYDPRNMQAENLGMPYPTEGVADVVADEVRGLLYVVTCENQHWMLYSMKDKTYRELGPLLVSYATTLIDAKGRAHVITKDFQLATYDPATDRVSIRPVFVGDARWEPPAKGYPIPIWSQALDGRTAYAILLNDPTLLRFDLLDDGPRATAADLGKMIDGKGPDSRSGLAIAPDGRIYALVSIKNETGFGAASLHHLVRYDPKKKKHEDLGVPAVTNPDFFPWKDGAGKLLSWSHGYQTLPDGTLTPLYNQGMVVTADNTVYATFLYPFTLLRIDTFTPLSAVATPATDYLNFALRQCSRIEENLPAITAAAEKVARRHLDGGAFVIPWNNQSLQQEIVGRAGGLMNMGREWKKDRTDAEKANDIAIVGWDRAPGKNELAALQALKARGVFILGFGPRELPALEEHVKLCDAFFDTGLPDDRVITLLNGEKVGRANHLINALNGWVFTAEMVGALTRAGKMPPFYQSMFVPEAKDWNAGYSGKMPFHDDLRIVPSPPGKLGLAYLDQLRHHLRYLKRAQLPAMRQAADLIAREIRAEKPVFVLGMGHMPAYYAGRYEDARWMKYIDAHTFLASQVDDVRKSVPDGGLVLRLGYFGEDQPGRDLFAEKKLRLIMMNNENPTPGMELPKDLLLSIDMGMAFGDACVTVEGYPIPILPPSGVVQIVAYEAINTEVLARQGTDR
jgi:hypothetical protein